MKGSKYYSCNLTSLYALIFNGRIDTGEKCIGFCCEPIMNIPQVALCETGKETIENFIQMRRELIAEGASSGVEELYSKSCKKCFRYQLGEWMDSRLVSYVALSMYPSPCQCRCIYCEVEKNEKDILKNSIVSEYYEKLFDALEYAKKTGLLAPNIFYQVSPGEITIHPYKDRIYDFVGQAGTRFNTNCFKYDERIAKNLSENPHSCINFSIDSGTQETWRKVKGFDNFNAVIANLERYSANTLKRSQIQLKYIVLPGINSSSKDYVSVINLMKKLGINNLEISCDSRIKYTKSENESEKLIRSAGMLTAMLAMSNLNYSMQNCTPNEHDDILSYAKILRSPEYAPTIHKLLSLQSTI